MPVHLLGPAEVSLSKALPLHASSIHKRRLFAEVKFHVRVDKHLVLLTLFFVVSIAAAQEPYPRALLAAASALRGGRLH